MLVLSRKAGESIQIAGQIEVSIVSVRGNRVKVGVKAPAEIPIVRTELTDRREVVSGRDEQFNGDEDTAHGFCCCI